MSDEATGARRAVLILAAVAASAGTARGQRPPGADTMSAKAVAESLAVIRLLDEQLKRDGENAALWYRKGMIAWALFDRDRARTGGVNNVDWTLIGRMADTSLRIAKQLEPNNPRYVLSAGQFFLGTGLATMRVQSSGMFGTALEISRTAKDADVHSEAALEVARVFWRKYDAVANAGYTSADAAEVRALAQALSSDTASRAKRQDPERTSKTKPYTRRTASAARRSLDRSAQKPVGGFPGEADYLQADRYMREAYETLPTYSRAYRHLGMLLAERARWTELEALADERLDVAPRDPWTWMTFGLASYRQGDTKASRDAFKKGLELMSDYERERLDHLERVLRPADTVDAATWTEDERADRSRTYWMTADPLWSMDDIDARSEFLARVAYAELRWNVEELSKRGADTDRGAIYIRYGPADRIASKEGIIDWTYDYYNLRFRFRGAPTYGTAYFADYGRAAHTIDSLPAVWDNTHLMQIDSIGTQAVRFRAVGDSVDVYFAARAPMDAIKRATDVAGPVRTDFWLLDVDHTIRQHDSTKSATAPTQSFTRRLEHGEFTYRFEASANASLVAGRSTAPLAADDDPDTGFPASGFGMSDILFATSLQANTSPAKRWRDVVFEPLAGSLTKDASLSLVWENYDFGNRDGNAQYRLSVTIVRERSRTGRISAQIVGAFGRAAGRDASLDRLQIRFDRTVPHAAVMVDQVTLALRGTPPGSYLLTIEVADQVTGKTTARTSRIVIGE